MPLLDVALAFSLTMLAVATAVSQIVNLVNLLLGTRAVQFRAMLERYLEHDLGPVVKRELSRLRHDVTEEAALQLARKAAQLQQHVLADIGVPAAKVEGGGSGAGSGGVRSAAPVVAKAGQKLIALSTDQLLEYVKRSDFGDDLLRELGDKAEGVFTELARSWESVGKEYTTSFRTRARYWATGIAFTLALVVNIDSLFILQSYYKNAGLRDAVIAQSETFLADYDELLSTLEQKRDEKGPTQQELKEAVQGARRQLSSLETTGLPLGLEFFPHAGLFDPDSADYRRRNSPLGILSWIAGVVLTSLLAGLGAPFWYDAVSKITAVTRRVRSGGADDSKG